MHTVTFLQDLAVVMIVAGLVMIAFRRLKQPVVLGYIIAGVIIGPHTPPYSLQDTFTKTNAQHPQNTTPQLSPLLAEANLDAVAVPADSVVAGKLIRELALRIATGAIIVCIECQNTRMLNPGPDEEILAGDKVMLLGSHEQLTMAKELLLTTLSEKKL
jgi:hypothetical protein